ncbi:MAG TPA: type II toxin-antitoxin system RelE/ParE family toxin [Chitinophagales bacterium]|nr:type II toxin-antitoxin system RelE/ParE family toxin [Chitinophagales bacterium]
MKFSIQIAEYAKKDISEAYSWYILKNESIADDFENQIYYALKKIEDNPFKFQIRYKLIRVAFLKKFPFGIHYKINDNLIEIIAVFHTSQNPENWFNRNPL